ncbi:MAG: hypothetical protein Q9180_004876 [Flavoplaca navasiana]
MKYGETLHQRSIPEWVNYNVDYNDLKRLIKTRTTRGQGEALSIPGHGNQAKALKAFENEFYRELHDQHQRVDLFVQSKSGEISRRLVHLDKQVAGKDLGQATGKIFEGRSCRRESWTRDQVFGPLRRRPEVGLRQDTQEISKVDRIFNARVSLSSQSPRPAYCFLQEGIRLFAGPVHRSPGSGTRSF